jgi:hypothetical protein
MTRFFDFHDSILTAVEFEKSSVIIRMKAILTVWEGGPGTGVGTIFSQNLEMRIEEASVEGGFANFPVWLHDGAFKAAKTIPPQEDVSFEFIPASLSSAEGVELRLEGEDETTCDYGTMRISGQRASVELSGEPVFIQELRRKVQS